jgi:uncharacterized pyridoxal phosphate-dependent enzyme
MSLLPSSNSRWSRRDILKQSGLLTAAAAVAPLSASAATVTDQPGITAKGTFTDNLYTQIGVRPIVNARGTYTIISGSQSLPEVKQAMFEASQYYVQLDELMAAVGKEIASLMGAPSAIVTTGCEAAIALATVACSIGTDPEYSQSLPYKKKKDQVIIPTIYRNQYDYGVRMSGPEIIEVATDAELRAKISDRTAMIYIISGPRAFEEPLSIKTICAIAKEKGVPVFVDAAAEEPLVPNIHLAVGATFVAYSGGKCMRGPQASGILLGPKDLTAAAFWNAAPHHNWGRALKVGKEEAMGILAAVRQWYKRDHDAEQKQWNEWLASIAGQLKGIPSLTTKVNPLTADLSNRAPTLTVSWDAAKVGITGTELVAMMDKGSPRVLVMGGDGHRPDQMHSSIEIMPYMMQPGDYKIVGDVVSKSLRNPGHIENPVVPTGALANLTGTWAVEIDFLRGSSQQQFVLEQKGTAVTGTQHGELYTTDMHGKVTADHVTLTSAMFISGSNVPYTFTGVVSGTTLSGSVKLGEYGAATFKAIKS